MKLSISVSVEGARAFLDWMDHQYYSPKVYEVVRAIDQEVNNDQHTHRRRGKMDSRKADARVSKNPRKNEQGRKSRSIRKKSVKNLRAPSHRKTKGAA